MSFNIVLHEPEIPQNTGNIARTCGATGMSLHLIKPLGFSTDEKALKRAGLDYWHLLDIHYYDNLDDFFASVEKSKVFYCTTKAPCNYTERTYPSDECYFMFGKESAGLPESLLKENKSHCIRIPMRSEARSLNLSNAVAIMAYEGLRQQGFSGLEEKGHLHRENWS